MWSDLVHKNIFSFKKLWWWLLNVIHWTHVASDLIQVPKPGFWHMTCLCNSKVFEELHQATLCLKFLSFYGDPHSFQLK